MNVDLEEDEFVNAINRLFKVNRFYNTDIKYSVKKFNFKSMNFIIKHKILKNKLYGK